MGNSEPGCATLIGAAPRLRLLRQRTPGISRRRAGSISPAHDAGREESRHHGHQRDSAHARAVAET